MKKFNNFLGIPPKYSALENSKVVVLSMPFDKTSSYIKGADKGPKALLAASTAVELYDIELDSEPYKIGIHTVKPVCGSNSAQMNKKGYKAVKRYLDKDKFVVTLGGEHSISYGPIKAHAEKYQNLSVLQLDAHTDLREEYEGNKYNHACIMARAKEIVDRIVQVGIRSMDKEEVKNTKRESIFYAHEIQGKSNWQNRAINQLTENVYITLDLDVLDPSILPSTGTPEPGGLNWYEVVEFLRLVFKMKNVVGFDVVELCPGKERASDFIAAKLVYKMIGFKMG